VLTVVALVFVPLLSSHPTTDDGWELAGRTSGIHVYVRHDGDSQLGQVLATCTIDAPPLVAKIAIDDFDAVRGRMPFIKETKVVSRGDKSLVVYNRTSAPLVADRDYTVRVVDQSYAREKDGAMVYVSRFESANNLGPPPLPGVVRVEHSEGEWRFEPIDGGRRTRAVYRVTLDITHDGLPDAVYKWGAVQMMSGILGALRERVDDPKYTAQAESSAQSSAAGALSAAPGTLGR